MVHLLQQNTPEEFRSYAKIELQIPTRDISLLEKLGQAVLEHGSLPVQIKLTKASLAWVGKNDKIKHNMKPATINFQQGL